MSPVSCRLSCCAGGARGQRGQRAAAARAARAASRVGRATRAWTMLVLWGQAPGRASRGFSQRPAQQTPPPARHLRLRPRPNKLLLAGRASATTCAAAVLLAFVFFGVSLGLRGLGSNHQQKSKAHYPGLTVNLRVCIELAMQVRVSSRPAAHRQAHRGARLDAAGRAQRPRRSGDRAAGQGGAAGRAEQSRAEQSRRPGGARENGSRVCGTPCLSGGANRGCRRGILSPQGCQST